MPLTNFFRINMPYGIHKNSKGQWAAFNREYLPLGHSDISQDKISSPGAWDHLSIFCSYKGYSEKKLASLSWSGENGIQRGSDGKITTVFLYDGHTPRYAEEWSQYYERIKTLSTFMVTGQDV